MRPIIKSQKEQKQRDLKFEIENQNFKEETEKKLDELLQNHKDFKKNYYKEQTKQDMRLENHEARITFLEEWKKQKEK